MGKRRRNRGTTRKETKPASTHRNLADARQATNIRAQDAPDVDIDCVQYHSDSEGENPPNSSDLRLDKEDTTSEEEDNSEPELAIGETVDDQSDVELSIEFFDPTQADVMPIQNFLQRYQGRVPTQKANLSARKLAEAICAQTRVGTIVRVTDDETPIGFISCLNMRDHKLLLKPIRTHLLRLCEKNESLEKFSKVLTTTTDGSGGIDEERMGLILCERVLNFPPLLAPKLLEALFCEIEWAVEDEPSEKGRESFKFGWYLYLTEVYYVNEKDDGKSSSKNQKEVKKKRRTEDQEFESVAFVRVEDEALYKFSAATLVWNTPDDGEDRDGIKRKQMAMLLSSAKIKTARQMVCDLVGFKDDQKQSNHNASGNVKDSE